MRQSPKMLLNYILVWYSLSSVLHVQGWHNEYEEHYWEDESVTEDKNIADNIIKNNLDQDSNMFEGDIDIWHSFKPGVDLSSEGDIDGKKVDDAIRKRNALRERAYLWHSKEIPYIITPELYSRTDVIQSAFKEYEAKTCLRFVPRTFQRNYLKFIKGPGCYSSVGRKYWEAGPQDVSLGDGCYVKGTIIHEVMHALGFWHEQSRPDRNQYVKVMWENINKVMADNFNKYGHDKTDSMVEYDYNSVMHYGKFAFSKNGKATILPIDESKEIGQRRELSRKDVQEINALYDCSNPSSLGWSSWSSWGKCDRNCQKKRQRFCPDPNKANCPGVNRYNVGNQRRKCSDAECYAPVDGHWGRWSAWESCTRTCDTGTKTRTRKCDDPSPANGGKQCPGSAKDVGNCKLGSCNAGSDDCEFETGMCHWQNAADDDEDWYRITGPTKTQNTGPSQDHSSGTGYYVYFEASSPSNNGDKARLESKVMTSSGSRCLSFWYHMYGSKVGFLRVFKVDANKGTEIKLFEESGNQGDSWKHQEITYRDGGQHKIVFEAQRGASFRGDIGLDDITFKNQPCGQDQSLCSSPLGMESGAIIDTQISASSIYDANHAARFGRLNAKSVWCVNHDRRNSNREYIQIKFDKLMTITAIATQGQPNWDNWVTSYQIKYSENVVMYKRYHENFQAVTFRANSDRNGVVKNVLKKSIKALVIRISPQSYSGTDSCMRVELYGCPVV